MVQLSKLVQKEESLMRTSVSKIYTAFCILSPILFVYSFYLPYGTWILLALFPIFAIVGTKINRESQTQYLTIIIVYLVLQLFLTIFITNAKPYISIMQTLFYLLSVYLFHDSLFDIEYGLHVFKKTCYYATIYLLIQLFFAEVFGINTTAYIPILKQRQLLVNNYIANNLEIRPHSFFVEPSGYGAYVGMYLCIALLLKALTSNKNIKFEVFLTLGIICARSSTGFFMMLLAWGYWFFLTIIKGRVKLILRLGVGLVMSLLILGSLGYLDTVFIGFTHAYSSATVRLFGFTNNLTSTDLTKVLFGYSMVTFESGYLSQWPRVYYMFGITGLIIWGIYLLSMFLYSKNSIQRFVVLIVFLTCFFAMALTGTVIPFYYSLMHGMNRLRVNKEGF